MKQTANYTALSNLLKLITEKDCLGYYKEKADAVAITEKLCELAQFDLEALLEMQAETAPLYKMQEEWHAFSDLQEMLKNVFEMVLENEQDFSIELESECYRIIHANSIDGIFEEECEEYAVEKYANMVENLPHIIQCAIDYKKIVSQLKHDGYGYGELFAHHDGYEHNVGDYFLFRVS